MPRLVLVGHSARRDGLRVTVTATERGSARDIGTVMHCGTPRPHLLRPYLLTSAALVGKLLLEAGHAEVATVFWDEGLGSYWLLAAVAQEAGLMPAVPLVFHFAGTWHRG